MHAQQAPTEQANGLPMSVCRPKLNIKGRSLSFMYKTLPENETSLVATGGTVNTLVASQTAMAAAALPAVATGSTYYNATVVVDVVGIISYVDPQAAQKSGLIHIDIGETRGTSLCLWCSHLLLCFAFAHIALSVLPQVLAATTLGLTGVSPVIRVRVACGAASGELRPDGTGIAERVLGALQ